MADQIPFKRPRSLIEEVIRIELGTAPKIIEATFIDFLEWKGRRSTLTLPPSGKTRKRVGGREILVGLSVFVETRS
jgi:hypothetical protein